MIWLLLLWLQIFHMIYKITGAGAAPLAGITSKKIENECLAFKIKKT
jgi:hypothetical protein